MFFLNPMPAYHVRSINITMAHEGNSTAICPATSATPSISGVSTSPWPRGIQQPSGYISYPKQPLRHGCHWMPCKSHGIWHHMAIICEVIVAVRIKSSEQGCCS